MIYAYLLLYALILLFGAHKLGIGADEAKIIFTNPLYHILYRIYPNELFVRISNILLSLVNVYLYYLFSKIWLKEKDALLSTVIFSLLPAIIASAVVINKAPLVLFLTLIFIYLYQKSRIYGYVFALLLLFVDHSFAILFLGMSFYALYKKSYEAFLFLGLFIASVTLYGFDVGGKPKNYFFDTFAIFAAIFSPLLFLYYFYTIYRILVKEKKDIVFFVSATAFLFSLFLSFRQRISLIDFAPFAVVGVVLMVRVYLHSLRVRLRKFQRRMRFYFWIVMGALLLGDSALIFNDLLFSFVPARKHFAYHHYEAKVLARELKKRGIPCVDLVGKLGWQLRFYGIKECKRYRLLPKPAPHALSLPIIIEGHHAGDYYVTKSNSSS